MCCRCVRFSTFGWYHKNYKASKAIISQISGLFVNCSLAYWSWKRWKWDVDTPEVWTSSWFTDLQKQKTKQKDMALGLYNTEPHEGEMLTGDLWGQQGHGQSQSPGLQPLRQGGSLAQSAGQQVLSRQMSTTDGGPRDLPHPLCLSPCREALWTLTASSQGWMSHPLCPVGVPLPQDTPASGRETPGVQPPWTPQTSCPLLPSCPSPPPSYTGHPSSRRGPCGELTVPSSQ